MNSHHHLQLTSEDSELHIRFVCTAPEDANCRRQLPNPYTPEMYANKKPGEDHTTPGHPCWAADWIDTDGVSFIVCSTDQVLASVPVNISYGEGVCVAITKENDDESQQS